MTGKRGSIHVDAMAAATQDDDAVESKLLFKLAKVGQNDLMTKKMWESLFNTFDKDGSGYISRKEYCLQTGGSTFFFDKVAKRSPCGLSQEEWCGLFDSMDTNADSKLSWKEIMASTSGAAGVKDWVSDAASYFTNSAAEHFEFSCFLTHDWGRDEEGRSNHERVVRLARMLSSSCLKPWLDQDEMDGDINIAMTKGIDNSAVAVVFVTKNYMDKVAGNGPKGEDDNCFMEFSYSTLRKNVKNMITVVMEPSLLDTSRWHGPVAAKLGSKLYIDMSSDEKMVEQMPRLVDKINGKWGPKGGARSGPMPPVLRMKSTTKPLSDILKNLQKDGKLTKGDMDKVHSRLEECFPPAAYLKQVGRSEGLSDQEFAEAISVWTESLAKLAADFFRWSPEAHPDPPLEQPYRDIIANWLLTFAEETLVPVSKRLASWSFPFFDRERKGKVTRVDMLNVLLMPLIIGATEGVEGDQVKEMRADGLDLGSGVNFFLKDRALVRIMQKIDVDYILESSFQEAFGVDAWFAFLSKDGQIAVPEHALKMIQDILAILRDVLTGAIESGRPYLNAILPTVGKDFVMKNFEEMEEAIEDAPKDALLGRSAEEWGHDLPGGVEVWGADLGDNGRDLVEELELEIPLEGAIQKAVSGVRDFLQTVQAKANKRYFSKALFKSFAPSKLLEVFDDTLFEVIAQLFDMFWQMLKETPETDPEVKAWFDALEDVIGDSGEDAVRGRILFKIEVELKKLLSAAFVNPLCDFLFDVVKVQDADLLLKLLGPSATSPPERLKERMTLLFNTFPSKNDEHLHWEAVWHFVERIALSAPKLIKVLLNFVYELLSMLCKELILPSASKLLSGASGGQDGVTRDDVRRFIEEIQQGEDETFAERDPRVLKKIFGSMLNTVMAWGEPRDGSKTQAHMGDS